ncbi:MAG TPA: rRNA maturation RNase YbeY [candidate division WOR-3 bacterium]|uniref:Endoribonuclease YbeY n=1 Tax=candidate division WOR-3 bacterium TaxID=2052148 RepID=A0A9C9K0A0_UNCW3|nr:rRNA maturation RNase YbeY [candidate division WOR-3 bacterium]
MKIELFNQSTYDSAVIRRPIIKLVKKIIAEEKFKLQRLNIIIADDDYLKKLNKLFFKKNRPTNVISFNLDEVSEIYVSFNQAKDVSELYYYIIHGLLHILGYDHTNRKEEKIMDDKCLKYLKYV